MRFTKIFLLSVLSLIALDLTSGLVCVQTATINSSNYYGGNSYSYKISPDDLRNTPSWNPEREDPPVSLRRALEIGRKSHRRFVKKSDWFEVKDINIMQMDGNKWLYNITFECQKEECRDTAGSSFDLWVKMDGSIIEPKIRPEINEKVFKIPSQKRENRSK